MRLSQRGPLVCTSSSSSGIERRQDVVKRLAEKAERASKRWDTCITPFLPLTTWKECEKFFSRRADIKCVSCGGYVQAERRRLLMGSFEVVESKLMADTWADEYLAAIAIRGNFKFDKKRRNHRHVLGSILGLGIDRKILGDIIIPDEGDIQAIVSREMTDYIEESLTSIARVPVQVERIPLSSVVEPMVEKRTVTKTCSSSRLDAVTSISFNISRSKCAEAIKQGEIQVNWEATSSPSAATKPGDVITWRGKGRCELIEMHVNHRDRTVVEFSLKS